MPAISDALLGLVFFGSFLLGDPAQAAVPLSVEAFTTPNFSIKKMDDRRFRDSRVVLYFVDGLEQTETALSQDLPVQPERAKNEALHRIQQFDDDSMAPAKNAAIGLAKAVQYGIDRYPAVVFDGRVVVYGVTDLAEALDRYDAWQQETVR